MTFVQIIDYRSDDPNGGESLADEWERATEGKRTARRAVTCRDRSDPNHFMTLVFFDSFDSFDSFFPFPATKT